MHVHDLTGNVDLRIESVISGEPSTLTFLQFYDSTTGALIRNRKNDPVYSMKLVSGHQMAIETRTSIQLYDVKNHKFEKIIPKSIHLDRCMF